MILLTIGNASRRLSSPSGIDETWIRLQLRADAVDPPDVHVRIDGPRLSLNLSAGDARFTPPVRPLREGEADVLGLWRERGLDRPDFRSGQLVAFLHQLYDLLAPGTRSEPAIKSHRTVVDAPICIR